MLLASLPQVSFRCPGEEYEISAAVHRARLAAGYEKCPQCPQRPRPGADAAGVSPPCPAVTQDTTPGVPGPPDSRPLGLRPVACAEGPLGAAQSIWQHEGVRGVYLNQVDRPLARTIAIAFAEHLRATVPCNGPSPPPGADNAPPPGGDGAIAPPQIVPAATPLPVATAEPRIPATADATASTAAGEQSPGFPASWPASLNERIRLLMAGEAPQAGVRVLLGHDERGCSPELAASAGQGLRQMGCQVIDLGLMSRPALAREIRIQQATGGMLLTGSGCDHEFAGCDLLGPQGEPFSAPGQLDDVHRRWRAGAFPAPRHQGRLTSRRPSAQLPAGWQSLLHGLRPLRIAWGCGQPQATAELRDMLSQTACQLVTVPWGVRARRLLDRSDPDLVQLRHTLLARSCHLGIAVGDDRQQCQLLDELGNLLDGQVVLRALNGFANRPWAIGGTLEEGWRIRREETQAPVTAGPAGYYWLPGPECDALRLLLHVLRWLSDSDEPTSRRFLHPRPAPAAAGEAPAAAPAPAA